MAAPQKVPAKTKWFGSKTNASVVDELNEPLHQEADAKPVQASKWTGIMGKLRGGDAKKSPRLLASGSSDNVGDRYRLMEDPGLSINNERSETVSHWSEAASEEEWGATQWPSVPTSEPVSTTTTANTSRAVALS